MVEDNFVAPVQPPVPFKPADVMTITDLETLRVLADPLRLSIVEYLAKPGTVKRIAQKLGKPPTKLYYHFNLLEKHDLIRLVDTRVVSGIIEKHYQASARSFHLERSLLSPGSGDGGSGLELTLNSLYADVRNDIQESLRLGVLKMDEDTPDHQRLRFSHFTLHLTDAQAKEFGDRYTALVREFQALEGDDPDSSQTTPYKALFIYYRSSRTLRDGDPDGDTDADIDGNVDGESGTDPADEPENGHDE